MKAGLRPIIRATSRTGQRPPTRHCDGLEKVSFQASPGHNNFSNTPAFAFRTSPYRRPRAIFFLNTPSALFSCRDAPPRRLLDTQAGTPRVAGTWLRSIRAAAASALNFSSEAARCNAAEGGGGSARVETACGLFSILLLRPRAACMTRGSKIKEKPQM